MAKETPESKEPEDSGDSIPERLDRALSRVDRPGTFCASGSVPAILPGLEVEGVGLIGLPLTEPQLTVLQGHMGQAPYGKGTETLVDTNVRRVRHLAASRFKLTNPAWGRFIDEMLTKVTAELGLEGQTLEAHPYDLLLYDPGGFFLPHRDGEKLDRMVATLVVVLPSKFDGGELIVRHEGREHTIDFSGPNSLFEIHYAAFYADCEHEVKPLTSGHRLCLVYNLTLAKSGKGDAALGAPRSDQHVARVSAILSEWVADENGPVKLAVTLGHQYTKDGLSWDALKGVDRSKADVLEEAARRAGCRAYLALLTFWQTGSAEDDGGYGRRRYYDEDDGDEDDGGEHTMTEVFDESLSAENWRSADGDSPPFGTLPVGEDEVVPPESLKSVDPEEDFEGYTGNAGMTLERWYRHGAIFLWPERRHFAILLQAGSRQALRELERMVADWRAAKGPQADGMKRRCVEFARLILGAWPQVGERGYSSAGRQGAGEEVDRPDPLTSLQRLDEPELLRQYVGDTLLRDASLDPGRAAAKAVVRHGWQFFQPALAALFDATDVATIERNAGFLEVLCEAAVGTPGAAEGEAASQGPQALDVCRSMVETTVAAPERIDGGKAPDAWRASGMDRGKLLAGLTRALLLAGRDDLLTRLVAHVRRCPDKYPLRSGQLPALATLAPWIKKGPGRGASVLAEWVAACRRELEALTAAEPQPPADFRRDANIACNCADCASLKAFLQDPRQQEGRFKMAQARRSHLEDQIRHRHLDVTHTTDRRSNTHTLVCTKTTASFDRRLKQYRDDLKHLEAVRAMQQGLGARV